MRAVQWEGREKLRVAEVDEPKLVNPGDAIIKVSLAAICGSDLHLYDGFVPGMRRGDVLGHEFMGEVVEVGPGVRRLRVGKRVVVPFNISCGRCWYCTEGLWALCDNTNPPGSAAVVEAAYGGTCAGMFGYSHLFGGYAGGQAEYVRVPFADIGCLEVNGHVDEQVLLLGDILPTAWMAVEQCDIEPGDVVAVFGCGPVGQLAIRCARLLGAERVIAVDCVPERLTMAAREGDAEVVDESEGHVLERLADMTGGRGPDACIDAVGMEAHSHDLIGTYDRVKRSLRLQTDLPTALRTAILACRKGGTVSIPGVYGGFVDKFPIGAAFGKGLTLRMGQTHTHRYMQPLLRRIEEGEIDPSFVITHRVALDEAPEMYRAFKEKRDGCVKVVLRP